MWYINILKNNISKCQIFFYKFEESSIYLCVNSQMIDLRTNSLLNLAEELWNIYIATTHIARSSSLKNAHLQKTVLQESHLCCEY